MDELLSQLAAFIFKRIEGRLWRIKRMLKFDRTYSIMAAVRFLNGTLNNDDINILGIPVENSGSPEGAIRWMKNGLGDDHIDAINRDLSRTPKGWGKRNKVQK